MKKTLVILGCALGIGVSAIAQEKTYKPMSGMNSLEVTFDPSSIFNASKTGSTFALPSTGGLNNGVKVRTWLSDNLAARNTFLLGFQNISNPTQVQNSAGDDVTLTDTYFEWALQLRPGVERHFEGTKRLSPYVGSELIIGFGSNNETTQVLNPTTDQIEESYLKNGTNQPWSYANGFVLGAGLVGGFDYYIAESLYLGLELNYAFVYNKRFNVKQKSPTTDEVITEVGSNWYFNPSAGANLRLGWNF